MQRQTQKTKSSEPSTPRSEEKSMKIPITLPLRTWSWWSVFKRTAIHKWIEVLIWIKEEKKWHEVHGGAESRNFACLVPWILKSAIDLRHVGFSGRRKLHKGRSSAESLVFVFFRNRRALTIKSCARPIALRSFDVYSMSPSVKTWWWKRGNVARLGKMHVSHSTDRLPDLHESSRRSQCECQSRVQVRYQSSLLMYCRCILPDISLPFSNHRPLQRIFPRLFSTWKGNYGVELTSSESHDQSFLSRFLEKPTGRTWSD